MDLLLGGTLLISCTNEANFSHVTRASNDEQQNESMDIKYAPS